MLTDQATGQSYCIPKARTKKAILMLDNDNIVACTHPIASTCDCTRECYDRMHRQEILALRKTMAELPNEEAVTTYLVHNIRRDGGLKVKGATVCRNYYAKLHEVGEKKVRKANYVAKQGDVARSGRAPPAPRDATKATHAHAFWSVWFDLFCNRPNDEVRLFPVNTTYKEIYQAYFLPWWAHQGHPNREKPSPKTFQKARYSPEFDDVKRRAKHFHCRCTVCQTLQTQSLAAFVSAQSLAAYQHAKHRHNEAIIAWRKLEAHLNALAIQNPEDMILLSYDDTEFISFPNMGNRPLKAQGHTGFRVVPWLLTNHGNKKRDYVYMPKGKWIKGANRVLSQIHATLSAIKGDPTNKQHGARRLVIIADNFSENKNKEILAYIADLVHNKWFDSVELLFGEVGHTHNGNDATHKVHNVDVGNHEAGDLGHFIYNYQKVWSDPATRPHASILDKVYNWVEYYARPEAQMRPLSGMTKTKYDNYAVRAFRASRGKDLLVDLTWQMDPATESGWRGADGHIGTAGFPVLAAPTTGVPQVVEGRQKLQKMRWARNILNQADLLAPFGLAASAEFNFNAARTGIITVIPLQEQVQSQEQGQWGRLCTIGSNPAFQGSVRLLENVWWPHQDATVWALPEATRERATSSKYHYSGDMQLVENRPLAYMRFSDEKAEDAPIFDHPNNVARREQEDDPSKPTKGGSWSSAGPNGKWIVDFDKCKTNHFAIVYVVDEDTKKTSIELYKVTKIYKETETFDGKMYICASSQLDETCLDGKWHLPKPNKVCTELEGDNVIVYFKSITKRSELPQAAKKAVIERGIFKEAPADELDEVEDNDDAESEQEEEDQEYLG